MISLRVVKFLCASVLAAVPSVGQETEKPLTVEEIVARHEATWAKLERFSVKTEEHAKVHWSVMNVDDNGKEFHVEVFPEVKREHEVYVVGLRQFAQTKNFEEGRDEPEVEVWIRDKGLVKRSTQGRIEMWNEGNSYPKILNSFGKTVERTTPANTALRNWVKTARPAVTTSKNDKGETLYHLKGKLEMSLPKGQYRVTEQTDELTVTINSAKGFLIEKMEYVGQTKGGLRDSSWQVQRWSEVADKLYFPGQFRYDYKGDGKDEDTWSEYKVVEFTSNPPDIEERFVYRIPEGAEVLDHDFKDHPGAGFISIWGTDDKPVRTFASYEAFAAHRDLEWAKLQAKAIEEYAASLWPDCSVATIYVPETKLMKTTVTDKNGEVWHEFRNEEELRIFALTRFYIGQALEVLRR